MSKYIDAGLLREKISAQMESIPREKGRGAGTITSKGYGMMEAFQIVRSIIDFLQQEQPSLPDNLDEAAEEYAYNNWEDNDYHTGASEDLPFDAIGHTEKCFKAGVEWMAEQGETQIVKTKAVFDSHGVDYGGRYLSVDLPDDTLIGTEFIIQIRKK